MVCWVAEICRRKCYTVKMTFRSHISFRKKCLSYFLCSELPPSIPVLLILYMWSLHLLQEFQKGNYNAPYVSHHNMYLINSNIVFKYNILIQFMLIGFIIMVFKNRTHILLFFFICAMYTVTEYKKSMWPNAAMYKSKTYTTQSEALWKKPET